MRSLLVPEALSPGGLTRGALRWNYSRVQPRVYRPQDVAPDLEVRTVEAWLWSDRRGIIAGRAAAALHQARWVEDTVPVEMITNHTRKRSGVIVREERITEDEICRVGDLRVTTPARTAFDLARYLSPERPTSHLDWLAAVVQLDALAAATGVTASAVWDVGYQGFRHVRRARIALDLMDGGAQSPKETWLRLMLMDAGYPRPRTQIPVIEGSRTVFIDMGWDEPKIGLDYEGDHHREQRPTYVNDIGRYELIERRGWVDLRVVKEHSAAFIKQRVREAAARRGWKP
jgi:hypothetical protein